MKLLKLVAVLAALGCGVSEARNRHVAKVWNTEDVCLEQSFGNLTTTGGWYMSSWLHAYFQTPDWWIYHCDKGWLFPESDTGMGVWFYWKRENKWVWTRHDVYPLAYSVSDQNWFNFCVK